MKFVFTDGGRKEAGYKGFTGDCCARAFAIATGRPYKEVYDDINDIAQKERPRKHKKSNARTGVYVETAHKLAKKYGMEWVPTMGIGTGCRVHVRKDELPGGALVLNLSRHFACVKDGVLYDTHDCSRGGTRCVYGYWRFPSDDS